MQLHHHSAMLRRLTPIEIDSSHETNIIVISGLLFCENLDLLIFAQIHFLVSTMLPPVEKVLA